MNSLTVIWVYYYHFLFRYDELRIDEAPHF
jgi:hypothetical protein